MNPITHFLAGWTLGLPADLSLRDRALVAFASISPDIDAMPAVVDLAKGRSLDALELGSRFHHSAHNIVFALAVSAACLAAAKRRWLTAALALVAVHLHYACDIAGSRGPDGYHWPIPYLMPFSAAWQFAVPWQWELNAWPNVLVTAILLAVTIYAAWLRGYSPVGIFSSRADQAFIGVLRGRFGSPQVKCKGSGPRI